MYTSKEKASCSDSRRNDGGLSGESGAYVWLVMRWRSLLSNQAKAEREQVGFVVLLTRKPEKPKHSAVACACARMHFVTSDIALPHIANKLYSRDQPDIYVTA